MKIYKIVYNVVSDDCCMAIEAQDIEQAYINAREILDNDKSIVVIKEIKETEII